MPGALFLIQFPHSRFGTLPRLFKLFGKSAPNDGSAHKEEIMGKRFPGSVAVAVLLATTGFAAAQGVSQGGAKGGEAPTAAAPKGETTSPSASPSMSKDSMGTDSKPGSTAQEKSNSKVMPQEAQDKAGPSRDTKSSTQTSGDMNKDSKSKSSTDNTSTGGAKTSSETSPAGSTKSGSPTAADSKAGSTTTDNKTTGNAATSATAAPPAEKQTQIASAIRQEKVEEVTNVNFNISVGAIVPGSVRYHPLPARIVEIYPEWRGYDFIVVRGRYIILRPQTHEIVYIIEG
jgi:hypothetical protein